MFDTIMFAIFGKPWVRYQMLSGLKGAIFVNEMEIAKAKSEMREYEKAKAQLEADYQALIDTPLKDPVELLPESDRENDKAIYDMKKKIEAERSEQIELFKTKIKEATTNVQVSEAEVDRTYGIAYSNRRKYDFIRKFKIVPTYADLNK